MGIGIATGTIRAVIDQIRNGRSEMTLLLGDRATFPGFSADETLVKEQIMRALKGEDAEVSRNVRRYVATIATTRIDVEILRSLGLDAAVCAYHLLSMDALDLRIEGRLLNLSSHTRRGRRICFDLALGDGVQWTTSADGIVVLIDHLPETLLTALISRDGGYPLTDVLSHPLLDGYDLRVRACRARAGGGAFLTLAESDDVAAILADAE